MADIKTKFSVGDTVYRAGTMTTKKRRDCPDCRGSRKWRALSPAGAEYEFDCPRCSASYRSDDALSLDYSQYAAHVERLTVGSVRVDTHDQDRPVSYMCRETGVGSGAIYDEKYLFATHDEAMKAAEAIAAGQNTKTPWVVKQYDKTLTLSDYQLHNAVLKAGRDERNRHSIKLSELFDELRGCETIEQVNEILDGFSLRDAA